MIQLTKPALGLLASVSLIACASVPGLGGGSLDERLEAHVATMASDEFGGRDTGSEGYDLAADYVAGFMREAGLEPAAPDYFQTVPLYRTDPQSIQGELTLQAGGETIELTPGETVAFYPGSDMPDGSETLVSGDLVFVGDGVVAPALGMDAYEGVDVRGKIVVFFSGTPKIEDNPAAVHLRRFDVKLAEAEKRGAAGVIYLDASDRAIGQYARYLGRASEGPISIGAGFDRQVPTALLGMEPAKELFAASGRDLDEVVEQVKAGTAQSFALDASAAISVTAEAAPVKAYNVIGKIEGTDPSLRGKAVVVTAHLDHVGTRDDGDPETDDIYNGALDNATGTAIIMEAARMLAKEGGHKRTIIVAALTGEEKGLLGAAHLARNVQELGYEPVANVNIDMPVLTYPVRDMIAFGAKYSTLGPVFDAAAGEVGLRATPDPVPEMSLFVRSDHYRFVQEGIPSLFLFNGMEGEGLEGFQAFMATHYHKPSDDMSLPINWEDGAKFTELTAEIVGRIADMDERPRWNEGVVFAKDEGPRG
ncbi:M28 family peptidase [Parvularcula maris]|uniref:M20/M25/M40 family metallo-hydrolase n=1 Tax=Parvularcula maris TaxID=2965077 RepID=A0A9X2L6W0_9PROT|nr:M28 family peptidase [Parvularcula maris]MCQ8184165.1 M20/M25/M40 family metallo-hydrolase [Parvularcula maris]